MTSHRLTLFASLALAGSGLAQSPNLVRSLSQLEDTASASGGTVLQRLDLPFGASSLDGKLVVNGPGYDAEFVDGGLDFSAKMPSAEQPSPFRMRVAAYGRGEPVLSPGSAEIVCRDDAVHYQRAGFVETYELRPDGVKQSFVFSQLPAGGGDQVVRVAGDLDLSSTLRARIICDPAPLHAHRMHFGRSGRRPHQHPGTAISPESEGKKKKNAEIVGCTSLLTKT